MASLPQPHRARSRRLERAAGLAAAIGLVAGALGSAQAACLPAQAETARVAEVRDARTILLADGRLARPAAIESFALIGHEAGPADAMLADKLVGLLLGRQVRLHFLSDTPDRYGRRAALLAGRDGLVQARLAAAGAAIAVPDGLVDGACIADILAAETAARRARAGRWTGGSVLPAEPGALSSHLGSYVIFEGEVLSVGNRTRRTYLNFGRRWSEDVTVVIEADDRGAFGGAEALEALAGRHVRVRGFTEERGGPMVTARRAGQIEILSPSEGKGNGS